MWAMRDGRGPLVPGLRVRSYMPQVVPLEAHRPKGGKGEEESEDEKEGEDGEEEEDDE